MDNDCVICIEGFGRLITLENKDYKTLRSLINKFNTNPDKYINTGYTLDCGHVFHINCIVDAATLTSNLRCPMCRKGFNQRDISFIKNTMHTRKIVREREKRKEERKEDFYKGELKILLRAKHNIFPEIKIPYTCQEDYSITSSPIYSFLYKDESYCSQSKMHLNLCMYRDKIISSNQTDKARIVFCDYKYISKYNINNTDLLIVKNLPSRSQNTNPNIIEDIGIGICFLEKIYDYIIRTKLIELIEISVNNYVDWVGNGKGFFNRHGNDGKRKALALKTRAKNAKTIKDVSNAIKDFFNNRLTDQIGVIGGSINSNNHSFISFFLNTLEKNNPYFKEILLLGSILSFPIDYHRDNNHIAKKKRIESINILKRCKISTELEDVNFIKERQRLFKELFTVSYL